jgi:outer membrane immunogenic protein
MLRHIIAGAVIVAAPVAPVLAADLIIEEEVFVPEAVAYDWTGFYVGVHGGGVWASFDSTSGPGTHQLDDVAPISGTGWVLGGNVGADWQVDSFVLGIEGQANWSNATASFVDPADEEWHADLDWYAALSARGGFAVDRALLYGKVGVVAAGLTLTGFDNADPTNSPTTASNTNLGVLFGVGAEFAATENISIFAEFEHIRLQPKEFDITGTGYHAVEDMDMTANVAKIGIRARM